MLDALNVTGVAAKAAGSEPASGRSVSAVSVVDARAADPAVIRAESPLPVAREMATNGLRQLGALLLVVERQLVTSVVTPAPLGYLARAMGDAAHQVGAGFAAMASAGSQGGADEAGTGAGEMTLGEQAAAPPRLIVTAYEDESKVPTLPFTTKTASSALEATLAAPPTDDWASVRPGAAEKAVADQSNLPIASGPGNDRNERVFALAADPGPHGRMANENVAGEMSDPAAAWRGSARQILRQTSDALEQMSERLRPAAPASDPQPDGARASVAPDLLWAMTQVAGAQRQVAASMAVLAGQGPRPRAASAGSLRLGLGWGDRGQLNPLTSAVAIFGTGLLLILMALVAGLWIASVTSIGVCAGLGAAILWGWRVSVGARGLRIALRR